MTQIRVPLFMNTLLAELQAEASARGLRLVGDTSTNMTIEVEATLLHGCLLELIGTMICALPRGSVISLITSCLIPRPPKKYEPALLIEISGPACTNTAELDSVVSNIRSSLRNDITDIVVTSRPHGWSLAMTLPAALPLPLARPRPTVVIADDDPDTQLFLRTLLEMQGLQVISASDGFDALLMIERHRPDLVLTDMLMPNMNGLQLISRIKTSYPQIPVIAISGYSGSLLDAIAGLPDILLQKPLTSEMILKAVAAVLPSKSAT